MRRFDPEWNPNPSFVESAEGAIRRAEGEAREAEARVREIFRDALPNSSPEWGEKRLREETVRRGFIFREPTKKSPGQLFINPRTGEELRIMERPRRRNSNDEPQKHIFDYYYRYRKSRNDPPGAAIPIPNKSNKKDSE